MTVTSTQSSDKGVVHRAVGSYISDAAAAAFDITTGFQPRYVRVTNEDGDCVMEWYEGMADSEGMKLVGDTTPVTYFLPDTDYSHPGTTFHQFA